jgi:hypothetical protein
MDKFIVYNNRVDHKEETDFEYEVGECIRVNSVERMTCVKKEVIEDVGVLHYFLDVNTIKNNKMERLYKENELLKIDNELLKSKWEAQGLMIQKLHKEVKRYKTALKKIAESEEDSSCNELALKYEVIAEKTLNS